MGCGASKSDSGVTTGGAAKGSDTPSALRAAGQASLAALNAYFAANTAPSPNFYAALDEKAVLAWIEAVQACVSVIWEPLVAHVEQRAGESNKRGGGWDQLTTTTILELLLEATGDERVASIASVTPALLDRAAALWARRLELSSADFIGGAAAERAFESGPLCQLLNLVAIAVCRTVGVEDAAGLERRVSPWRTLRSTFGLASDELCCLLDGRSKAFLLYLAVVGRGDSRLKLSVGRETALWDALPQFEASGHGADDSNGGSVKLFPRFYSVSGGGWEGGEGHGPRKELFTMLGKQLTRERGAPLPGGPEQVTEAGEAVLPYAPASRQHWLPLVPPSESRRRLLWYAGWLVGQTMCNRSPLQVSLPPLLFRCLLAAAVSPPGSPPPAASLALLKEFDPAAANNLAGIATLKPADFAAMCELDGLEPAATSRDAYVHQAADRLLYGGDEAGGEPGVRWQLRALAEGFEHAVPRATLSAMHFSAPQLAHAICGLPQSTEGPSADFSIRTAFRVAVAEELSACKPLATTLWKVLDNWKPPAKRALVQFITGSDRLPPPGGEVLTIQPPFDADGLEGKELLGMLPQAHTCDNLLELPNYWEGLCVARRASPSTVQAAEQEAEQATGGRSASPEAQALLDELASILHARLDTAVHECAAYSLDETPAASAHNALPPGCPTLAGPTAARGAVCSSAPAGQSERSRPVLSEPSAQVRAHATPAPPARSPTASRQMAPQTHGAVERADVATIRAESAATAEAARSSNADAAKVKEAAAEHAQLDLLLADIEDLEEDSTPVSPRHMERPQPSSLSSREQGHLQRHATSSVGTQEAHPHVDDLITEFEAGELNESSSPHGSVRAEPITAVGKQARAPATVLPAAASVEQSMMLDDFDLDDLILEAL